MPSMGPAAESGAFSLLSFFYKNRMSTRARCIMGPVATRRSLPSFPFSTKIESLPGQDMYIVGGQTEVYYEVILCRT
jgi:hypothetical protein